MLVPYTVEQKHSYIEFHECIKNIILYQIYQNTGY